jgi:hypothetical protein
MRRDAAPAAAGRQAGRGPGAPRAVGAARGAAAREQDLPIAGYDDLGLVSGLLLLSRLDASASKARHTRPHWTRSTRQVPRPLDARVRRTEQA